MNKRHLDYIHCLCQNKINASYFFACVSMHTCARCFFGRHYHQLLTDVWMNHLHYSQCREKKNSEREERT